MILYVIHNKTDRNYNKPYVAICTDYIKCLEIIEELRESLSDYCKKLVYFDTVYSDRLI